MEKTVRQTHREPAWVKFALLAITGAFLGVFLLGPLLTVLREAFGAGLAHYWRTVTHEDTLSAVKLTLLVSVFVVPANTVFGLCAAWAITRFDFPGKTVLMALIDLPFSVSPVVSGLIFVLLFGAQGYAGAFFMDRGWAVIFALPGILLATAFITVPMVARIVIPVMQANGRDEEEAALCLGANGWQTFFRVTLPNIKWGLLYAVILLNARATGEFGAVSVVSGKIRGETVTMPLHVEILYNEYNMAGAFAVASLLTLLAVATLILKQAILRRMGGRLR